MPLLPFRELIFDKLWILSLNILHERASLLQYLPRAVPIDNGKISLVQAARECSNVFYWTVLNQCSPLSSSVLRQFNFWYTKGELGKNDSNVHSLNSEFMALRIYFVSGYQ
jgi:hypothetical protein